MKYTWAQSGPISLINLAESKEISYGLIAHETRVSYAIFNFLISFCYNPFIWMVIIWEVMLLGNWRKLMNVVNFFPPTIDSYISWFIYISPPQKHSFFCISLFQSISCVEKEIEIWDFCSWEGLTTLLWSVKEYTVKISCLKNFCEMRSTLTSLWYLMETRTIII
jgi:hypothetical protein